ncbi:phosphotransferase [Vibrio fluvialis]|nr:phosphotransferase [Vibrio fluvialis]MBY7880828.1 phosphotransferase [Vibrio fluvialis]
MAQMGASSVQRTRWSGLDAIVKTSPSAVELAFYQHTAPLLRAAGIHIPELLSAELDQLVIERIPHPVALDEFHSCDIGLAQIAKLHRTDIPSPIPLKRHGWSQEQTDQTLALLSLPERSSELLRQCQVRSHTLFNTEQIISGDTNSGNWGKRTNGDWVLFDWERFGHGNIAIDLAPLIPGMGEISAYSTLALRYTCFNPDMDASALARHILLSKAWLVTEVVTLLHQRRNPMLNKYVTWYNQTLPDWFERIAGHL